MGLDGRLDRVHGCPLLSPFGRLVDLPGSTADAEDAHALVARDQLAPLACRDALGLCQQRRGAPCKLYAVNGSVVWVKEVASQR